MTVGVYDKPCPVCGTNDWGVDWVRTADGEMPVPECNECGWPGPGPRTVEEARVTYLASLAPSEAGGNKPIGDTSSDAKP